VQIDSGKLRIDEGRHSGLFSFIRRSSLGDKKPHHAAANVQHMTTPSESVPVAPPADSRQNDGILFPL